MKKKSFILTLAALVITLAVVMSFLNTGLFHSRPMVKIAGQGIEVELARTPAEQAQGLSDHAPLADNQGMLFIFPDQQVRQFWMKDMLFPLDIIWLSNNRIIKIDRNLAPEGEKPKNLYSSNLPVDRVLEINAGWADKHRVKENDLIQYLLSND